MSTPWRLLAGTLGVLALALMASVLALGVLMATHSYQAFESPFSVVNFSSQRGYYSLSCPQNWIWNRGNCYYISTEAKTWPGSQTACKNMNSSLLKIEDREELKDFLKLLKSYYWTGLSRRGPDEPWRWEDGSGLSHNLLSEQEHFFRGWCVHYGFSNQFSSEDCHHSTTYICKQSAI
ncbi:NKG2-D type II integral membrane protein-like [Ornithorhynchus anatinus]|uniref:Natural killer cells antigen CD94 n=1 Tax=Ornithorhynchus anatinus TaxID=9258 RepID=F6PGB3_ORNAN|nr:NKG2-D type II integral membrane protein-like [Ornithorhynchus anatinus]